MTLPKKAMPLQMPCSKPVNSNHMGKSIQLELAEEWAEARAEERAIQRAEAWDRKAWQRYRQLKAKAEEQHITDRKNEHKRWMKAGRIFNPRENGCWLIGNFEKHENPMQWP